MPPTRHCCSLSFGAAPARESVIGRARLQIFCNTFAILADTYVKAVSAEMHNDEQFTRLWTKAQPLISSFIMASVPDFQDAEDLLQNVAVACLRKFDVYDPRWPFLGWALGMAKIEIARFQREHARK